MANLYRQIITKKIINIFIDFLRNNLSRNKLYNNVSVSDRFQYETALLPCVIIRQTSNTQRRTDFSDFMIDNYNRVQLIPLSGNNLIVGNNVLRDNLPITVDWNPNWAWDTTFPLPSGSDIGLVVYTSGTPPYDTTNLNTGIVITVPPPSNFIPISIEGANEIKSINPYTLKPVSNNIPSGAYNLAIGVTGEQYYLIYSGTGISGTNVLPVQPDEYIINPSGMPSGVAIKLDDTLFVGDQYLLNTYPTPQFISERFGGIYDITINFDLYAMSTIEIQELCDVVEHFLVTKKRELYNNFGLSLTSWSKGGESEEAHLNEYIFKASLTTQGFVEWHEDKPVRLITEATVTAIPVGGYTLTPVPIIGEMHTQTGELSGTRISPLGFPQANSILSVYASGITYPSASSTSIPEASGAGWLLSGNSIVWTEGSYPNFASVEPSGWVPTSGTPYLINYDISGYLSPGVFTNAVIGPVNPVYAHMAGGGPLLAVPSGV